MILSFVCFPARLSLTPIKFVLGMSNYAYFFKICGILKFILNW